MSDAFLHVEEGSLYPALHRLEHRGWVAAEWGASQANRRAKYYRLTPKGKKQLQAETAAWTKMTRGHRSSLELSPGGGLTMSWTSILPGWLRSANEPLTASGEDEIDEELMFHLRSLVEDNLAKGMSFDDAWRNAQERFGSLRRYARACRRASPARRLIFQVIPALGFLIVVGLFVGSLMVELQRARRGTESCRASASGSGTGRAARRPFSRRQ